MTKTATAVVLGLLFVGPTFAGTTPVNPAPSTDVVIPETPEGRRDYKVNILERAIAEDKATISGHSHGKAAEHQQQIKIAKENLKMNEDMLVKVKGGADMEAYFCSQCGREYMKEGTCPHCKKPLTSFFAPGAKRPVVQQHQH